MEVDVIRQFGELMEAFGMRAACISSESCDVSSFDKGLRKLLYGEFDWLDGIHKMEEFYEDNTIYIMQDTFEVNYISFKVPWHLTRGEIPEFYQIGPFITKAPEEMIERVIERNQLRIYMRKELREYYYSIALITAEEPLETIVITQAGYLFGGREKVKITRIENVRVQLFMKGAYKEPEEKLSMAVIEERYHYEERMLDAIKTGDLEKVIEINNHFKTYRLQPRGEDSLRNAKNLMIVWNTLFRKAVQEADVHPAHIDHISATFAKRIETCTNMYSLEEVGNDMRRKYCLLVRNHSLRGYSSMVRDTLNYIDFNLTEPLALKLLAEKVNANASYLSTQFKKEVGKTLTDYINEKRIHSSLVLLATTDLPIQVVAERVGIYDENYFSRLFKKYQNRTAKQYRNLMQSKI